MNHKRRKRVKIIFARPVGMLSLFHQVLEHIVLSSQDNSIPIVYFNDYSLFWSASGYNGARNVWEYYFYPISNEKIESYVKIPSSRLEHADIWEFKNRAPNPVLPRRVSEGLYGNINTPENVYVTNLYTGEVIPWIFDIKPQKRKLLGETLRKHIKVKDCVLKKVNDFYDKDMAGQDVLGVHIRGGEHSDEREFYIKGGFLSINYYVREIDAYLDGHPKAKIYVASDVQDNIEQLRLIYPDKIIAYDATRLSRRDESIGLHSHPDYNKARLGEEVIVEMLLLSRCNFLIHGPSNVSAAAMLFNPYLQHTNVYKKYGMIFPELRYNLKDLIYKSKLQFRKLLPKTYIFIKSLIRNNP